MKRKKPQWKRQETQFTCGPASFRNCLLYYDIKASEDHLRKLMDTDKNGTTDYGLIEAADAYGFKTKEIYSVSKDVFGRKLLKGLKAGHIFIMLVDATNHWVAVLNYKKRKIKVIDSSLKNPELTFNLKQTIELALNFDKQEKRSFFYCIEMWPESDTLKK